MEAVKLELLADDGLYPFAKRAYIAGFHAGEVNATKRETELMGEEEEE